MMMLLTAIQDNVCWIDKYANWYTFGGFVLAIVSIALAVYFYKGTGGRVPVSRIIGFSNNQ